MLLACKQDYKRGYKKHIAAYRLLADQNQSVKSRCLLLVYSVECGLKYKLMDAWSENSIREWIDDKEDYRAKIMKSHNIQSFLKELNQEGAFHFPHMRTAHNQSISTDTYHQFCRYGIEPMEKDRQKGKQYEDTLVQIAEWIGEEI